MRFHSMLGGSLCGAALLIGIGAGPAVAGLVVVTGDSNLANALAGGDIVPETPGNKQFFTNLLGSGTRVLVVSGAFSTPDTRANNYYNAMPGVTSTIDSDGITAADLVGVNLVMTLVHQAAFTTAEKAALLAYSTAGGSLLVGGDSATAYTAYNAVGNDLLSALGSELSIVNANDSPGNFTATGAAITPHPLTSGVTSLAYNSTSRVSGGTTLFKDNEGFPFVAASVPEPTSLAGSCLGLAALLGRRARRTATA